MLPIFGPRYPSPLKQLLTVCTDIFPCLKNSYIIGAARFSFVLARSVAYLDLFLDFSHEMLQNYLFLEVFQNLMHCQCKSS